jgi:hypothetical protein
MTDTVTRKLSIKVRKLEDIVTREVMSDIEIPSTDMSQEAIDWLQKACDVILEHPLMKPSWINSEFPEGDCADIEVIVCDASCAVDVFDLPDNAMGLHMTHSPDCDLFGEDAPYTRKARCVIFWDKKMATSQILGDVVTRHDLECSGISWLGTLTHELQHALLFMENGNFNSPNDVEIMNASGEVNNDVFDVSSSYGIRSLNISGIEFDGEDADDQCALMEEYVEQRGMRVAESVFADDLSLEAFLKVSGIEKLVKQEVGYLFDDFQPSSSVAP